MRSSPPSRPSSPPEPAPGPAALPDADGEAGDIQWNFEKFLIGPEGQPIARFRPRTEPEDPEVVAAIEASLPA